MKDIADIYLVAIACLCTLFGLGIYLYGNINKFKHFFAFSVISWLFIPLFPLIFILTTFPESTTEGELFKFKVTGAFASFVLLWFVGIIMTKKGADIDKLNSTIKELEEKCKYVETINNISLGAQPKPLNEIDVYNYELNNAKNKKIAIITGDIANVKDIDVWVNSENTNMQMARFGETSISSIIRYLGAAKEEKSRLVVEDTIANQLREKLGTLSLVAPCTVIVTDSGQLQRRNGVKKIFHVASVHGLPISGYEPIERIQDCIISCLEKVDDKTEFPDERFHTILFSLMGTGTAGGNLDEIVIKIINAAITYLEQNKESTVIDTVFFLAYTDRDLAACKKVLLESAKVSLLIN